jgi:putative restriction endonuclease
LGEGTAATWGTIAVTDDGWYRFLVDRPQLTELNFWTPSARRAFHAPPFSPFLFKLRAPHNAICGFACFAQFSRLPDWLAWESFGEGNGCSSFADMRERIALIRARIGYDELTGSEEIGCIQLVQPTFFAMDDWVPQPNDWRPRTQSSARYDIEAGEGRRVWEACVLTASASTLIAGGPEGRLSIERQQRYGEPRLVQPRLGQATFRIAVLEAYGRGCAVTEEHSLPALEASHIRPYAKEGPHEVRNGLLLRADLHRLFDTGYATVTPDLRLEISARLRQDYHNGRSYYPLHGARVQGPVSASLRPEKAFLEWHNQQVFRS